MQWLRDEGNVHDAKVCVVVSVVVVYVVILRGEGLCVMRDV